MGDASPAEGACTWSWRGSTWRAKAVRWAQRHRIYQVGGCARRANQGIVTSVRDGGVADASIGSLAAP